MSGLALFCHSLRSDWNHGNAHFLRGVLSELQSRGIPVCAFEPADGWSARNLAADHGRAALDAWRAAYPDLPVTVCDPARLDLDRALEGAALVLVHEWNDPTLVARLAAHRKAGGRYLLLFHDTHHRMISAPEEMAGFDLDGFDAVLAFGEVLRQAYVRRGWARRAFTWHEGADLRVFRPLPEVPKRRDLVWVGNCGDDERTAELREFLIEPVAKLGLSARVHGVRYPAEGLAALAAAAIDYAGYLPNFRVPRAFAEARMTVHVPRRPYVRALPGIPTIRVFEALACGIPLVSAPWEDCEGLFAPGEDFLVAADGNAMRRHLARLRADPALARDIAERGRATVEARHSCSDRVDELLAICRDLGRDLAIPEMAPVEAGGAR
ncbi:MAG: glycosyltransferase [Alphaproteobacteria bacterium]|nr:glycosyltransferase [Alphaproteobacteria bacterium]